MKFKSTFPNHSEEIKEKVKDLFEGEIQVYRDFRIDTQIYYYVILPEKFQVDKFEV